MNLFGRTARKPHELLDQFHMDVAASIQQVLEDSVLALGREAVRTTGERKLCMAGGVALNCVANGRLWRSGIVEDLWIQPAAGDAGGAVGCALYASHAMRRVQRHVATGRASDGMRGAYLGPSFSDEEIEAALTLMGVRATRMSERQMIAHCVSLLTTGSIVGWFQGRMEFGPRALGARSILADPRAVDMQRILNTRVKNRELFSAFCSSNYCRGN